MNVEEQEKRLLDYKWHERRYSKDTCYILSTQGTEEPIINILRLFQHLYYSINLPLKTLYFFQRKEISFFASIHPHHHKIQQFLDAVLSTFVDILLGGKSPLAADRWQPI